MVIETDSDFRDDDPTDEFPLLSESMLEEFDLDATAQFSSPLIAPKVTHRETPQPAEAGEASASSAAQIRQLESLSEQVSGLSAELARALAQNAQHSAQSAKLQRQIEDQARTLASSQSTCKALQTENLALKEAQAKADRAKIDAPRPAEPVPADASAPGPTQSPQPQPDSGDLREQIAALSAYILLRQREWRETAARLDDAQIRIQELALELTQRVEREQSARAQADQADQRVQRLEQQIEFLRTQMRQLRGTRQSAEAEAPIEPEPATAAGFGNLATPAPAHPDPDPPPTAEAATAIPEVSRSVPAAPAAAGTAPPRAQLVCLTSDPARSYALTLDAVTIGRSARCDIKISTHFVSREHAGIIPADQDWIVEDLGSKNGVFVNAVRVHSQCLRHGDLVTIGDAQFRFSQPVDATAESPRSGPAPQPGPMQ